MSPMALYQSTQGDGRSHRHGVGVASELGQTLQWVEVEAGGEEPFDFSHDWKRRHWVWKMGKDIYVERGLVHEQSCA